ncbi:MAG: response regulator [Planctomycetes bacterium]|nr:response regulator [Planctomycetota bacterium]MCH9724682.1 response regulator [Planctomycetota bacterium]MCH9774833.1 response regulator [Planctomycetota bacterium]
MSEFVIYIIDDDLDVLDSVGFLLSTSGYKVKTFDCVHSFLESREVTAPGCILMDLIMPDVSGIEAMELFKKQNLSFPVIAMSAYGDIERAVSAVKQGACDYLEKPFPKEKCISAIEHTKTLLNLNEDDSKNESLGCFRLYDGLTRREKQVFHLIAEGHSGKKIASLMSISYRTMEKHKANVLSKLGISSSTDIVHLLYKIKDLPEFNKMSVGT